MPDVLPTINNEPAQGIQATLDTVYLWNPDVANELIEQINVLLEKLEGVSGTIKPYDELEAPIKQYTPMFYGDGLYVAKEDMDEIPATVDLSQWILVATKATDLVAGSGIVIHDGVISVTQAISEGAAAGATAVQPGDLGTAAYAATTDFATSAQGAKADTALQPGSSVPQYLTMPVASADNLGEIVQYVGAPASGYATGYFYKCVNNDDVYTWENIDVQAEPNIGRFLSLWNCATGLAETNPPQSPYAYRAGDYFVVGTVSSATPAVNYKPNGSSYVIGTASSAVESGEVYAGDSYFFDGTNWRLQSNTAKTVTFANIAGDIYDNQSAAGALNAKQDALVSGTNIKTINGNSVLGSGDVTLGAKDVGAISQYTVLPVASATNVGDVVQYSGPDIPDTDATAIGTATSSTITSVSVAVNAFMGEASPSGAAVYDFSCEVTPITVSYRTYVGSTTFSSTVQAITDLFTAHGYDFVHSSTVNRGYFVFTSSTDCNVVDYATKQEVYFSTNTAELEQYGITLSDTPSEGDSIRYSRGGGAVRWYLDGNRVTIGRYGITFEGHATDGDIISVSYTPKAKGFSSGYFYKCEPKYTAAEISIAQTVGSTLSSISVDMDTFVAQEQPTGSEVVDFVFAAEIGTYSILPWATPNFSASIDASVFVPLCEQKGWNYNFMAVGNTNGLEDGYWYFGYTSDEPYASNLTISDLADYGITVTDLDPSASYNMAIFGYTAGNTEWRKDGVSVDPSSYGISYSGTPANGDVLTVDYTAPIFEGYYWIQKDVQPGGSGGINWETEIELPSSLGSGTFYPVFTIPGGLPAGTYEFYYQAQRYGISSVNGLVTYLFHIKLTPSGSSFNVGGYVAPVINGQFGGSTTAYGGEYVVSEPTDIGYFVHKNGNDYILYLSSQLFACDANYQGQAQTIPGAFKLSTIKSLTTGDEFVASGEVYTGQSIGDSVYCNVMATPIQDTTPVPSYFLTGSALINQHNANGFSIYAVGDSQDGFGINYLRVMLSYGQDFYDATLKTFFGNDYELTVNSATGVFANAQVGRDTQYEGIFFVKLDESIDGYVGCIVEWLGKVSELRGQNPRVEAGRVDDEFFTEFEPLAIGRLSPKYVGKVLQYTGETNSSYTNGYFYKLTGDIITVPASVTCTETSSYGKTITMDVDGFVTAFMTLIPWVSRETVIEWLNAAEWPFIYNVDNGTLTWNSEWSQQDAQTLMQHITISPAPDSGEVIEWTTSDCVDEHTEVQNLVWARIGVQPGGGGGSVPTLTWYSVASAGNTLTIANTASAQLVKVYKNGLLLQPTDDYTISGTTLTTVGTLVVGDKITTEVF